MASVDEEIQAKLRARVAELEHHAALLRDSRAKVRGTLASIHAALDGRPASGDEPEIVRKVAGVVAEVRKLRARNTDLMDVAKAALESLEEDVCGHDAESLAPRVADLQKRMTT